MADKLIVATQMRATKDPVREQNESACVRDTHTHTQIRIYVSIQLTTVQSDTIVLDRREAFSFSLSFF